VSITNLTKPYTYLVGWSAHDVWYYGVRFAVGCSPDELWKTYFTSSKYVHEFANTHGDPDIIEVRKTFTDPDKAQVWEEKVLKRLKVVERRDFLNKTDTNKISSVAISNGLKKFWAGLSIEERREHLSAAHTASKLKPKVWTVEARQANRDSSKAFWNSLTLEEKRELTRNSRLGTIAYQKSLSAEEKSERGRKAGSSPRKEKTCPHCGRFGKGNMTRWHFDNCKLKP
jgi:hypothetical protein